VNTFALHKQRAVSATVSCVEVIASSYAGNVGESAREGEVESWRNNLLKFERDNEGKGRGSLGQLQIGRDCLVL
jgi:hypothetical protein